jgi:hypothetical protein
MNIVVKEDQLKKEGKKTMRNAIEKLQQEYAELFEGKYVRETEEGLFSVYDYIGLLTNTTNPSLIFNRMCSQYPELLSICKEYVFTRKNGKKGNQKTPVTDRVGLLRILGLLPGVAGKKYRQNTGDVIERFLRADVTLAEQILSQTTEDTTRAAHIAVERIDNDDDLVEVANHAVDNLTEPGAVRRVIAHAEVQKDYLTTYHEEQNEIALRGGVNEWGDKTIPYSRRRNTFAETNRINTLAVGEEPVGNRNHFTDSQKIQLSFIQKTQTERMRSLDLSGHESIIDSQELVATRIAEVYNALLTA